MSALGQKQTFAVHQPMSALGQERHLFQICRYAQPSVRLAPLVDAFPCELVRRVLDRI